MQAIVYHQYGLPDVLKLEEVNKPTPRDNEVLVKTYAASVNDWDWELLQGIPFINRLMAGLLTPRKLPILGCDIAGRVETVGKNVKQFQPGDEVFGDISRSGWGGFAEYVCARENALTLKPANLTFEQAAAVPQAGLLALQGLLKGKIQQEQIQQGESKPAQKVLINGASGGAGSFAVQIAKLFGAEVTGVCRTKKLDFVRSLGVDHVIDYTHEDFTKNGQSYDLILDMKAYHSIFDYRRALSPRGIYLMVGGESANQVIFLGTLITMTTSKKMSLLLYKANKEMAFMKELLETGKVVPVIDKCYPLSETAEALRYFGAGHKKGKVVITVEGH